MGTIRPLVQAAHPGPAVVVTVVTVGLGVAVGLPSVRLVLLATAVLAGQVSIGWSNDWIDGRLGRDTGRVDKPTATGAVEPDRLKLAALMAVAVCVIASLALGLVPGLIHLVAVGGGWIYNARLKSTPASVLPYVMSFGLLPVIVATMAGGPPPWWAVVTAACFGAGVHFANVLPDLDVDARTGVDGLPQRLGATGSVVATVVLLGVGAAVVLLAPAGSGGLLTAGGAVGVAVLLSLTAIAGRRGRSELAYKAAMMTGLAVVAVLVARGDALA